VKAREYSGPLGILAAGAIGLSLLCGVSAMAMGDLNRYIPITLEPLSIVDLAVANFETAAALTEQIVTAYVPTATITPTSTDSPVSPTLSPSATPRRFVTITPDLPRRTRLAPTLVPSRTSTRPPTRTPTRIFTRTPTRTPTRFITRTYTPTPIIPTKTNTPPPPTTPPYPDPPTSTPTPPVYP
jgi:hypothetical protein